MRANGSDPRPLTRGTEPHADPRFSPDGKSILYTVLRGGFPEVWVMNRDGSAPRKVTPGCQADWSPDGRQIAFIRDNQVWVRELASGQERHVTPEAWQRCGVPAWRPDGKQFAVASRHTGTIGIYFLSLDGKEIAPLATEEPSCTPRWSRDGRRLLCQTVKGHVHQVGSDGRNWEQVTDGADVQHDAQYSPDGSMIVFCRAPSAEGPWKICVSRLGDDEMDFLRSRPKARTCNLTGTRTGNEHPFRNNSVISSDLPSAGCRGAPAHPHAHRRRILIGMAAPPSGSSPSPPCRCLVSRVFGATVRASHPAAEKGASFQSHPYTRTSGKCLDEPEKPKHLPSRRPVLLLTDGRFCGVHVPAAEPGCSGPNGFLPDDRLP